MRQSMSWALIALCIALAPRGASAASNSDQAFAQTLAAGELSVQPSWKEFFKKVKEGASAADQWLTGHIPNAPAPDVNSPWEDIKKAYYAPFPLIQFGTTWVSVDGVCRKGSDLVAGLRKRCVAWEGGTGERDGHCVKTVTELLTTPINYERQVCTRTEGGTGERDGRCVATAPQPESHPTEYLIEVKEPYQGDPNHPAAKVLFKKPYTIDVCPTTKK